jgi:uncharacterized membrane protein YdcZ (DUF606 family)
MTPQIIGIILILFGTFHILKPDLLRRLMWRKIVFNPQRYSPQQHKMYMRFLGVFLILIGIFLILAKFQ